jgi:hypothetical protein
MPKIRWTNLPPILREHLFDRVAERQIPAEDLYKLKLWRESEPEAPDGPCTKISDRSRFVAKVSFPLDEWLSEADNEFLARARV